MMTVLMMMMMTMMRCDNRPVSRPVML